MFKRMFDIVASALGLLVLSPLIIALALLVKLTSPGPVFYRATRVGRYNKTFMLLKLRSMVVDADRIGPGVTGARDQRITWIGHRLRKSKLDELPQLINVLRGEMSIVGPRPEDPRYVTLYTDEQRKVLNVRPGITSPASVTYRNEEAFLSSEDWETHYIEHLMPDKLAIDLEYARNSNLWRDVHIIVATIRVLLS